MCLHAINTRTAAHLMSQKRLDRNLSVARDREQSSCCSQADWSKQKHIEPPPPPSSSSRADHLYLFMYPLLAWRGARGECKKRLSCVRILCACRWDGQRRWWRRHIMNSEAMVRWWRMMRIMSTCMVRALCSELMRCSLMCSLIKAIYLLATEHTLEFSRMYFDRPHYVLHNHSLMAASSSSPPPPL